MKICTLADIRNLGPCYNPVRYLPETWQGTVVDVLDCIACPATDRIWVAVRLLPSEQVIAFARDCAAAAQRYADKAKGGAAAEWAIAADWAVAAEWAAKNVVRDAAKARNAARDAEWAAEAAARNMVAEDADWAARWEALAARAAKRAELVTERAALAATTAERKRQIEVLKKLAREET